MQEGESMKAERGRRAIAGIRRGGKGTERKVAKTTTKEKKGRCEIEGEILVRGKEGEWKDQARGGRKG